MKTFLLGTAIVSAAFATSIGSGSAATLDDVMGQLQSMQRDNQAIRRDNEAMRKELAALRQNTAPATRQAGLPVNAQSRVLPANLSNAMAADLPASRGYYKAMPVEGPYNWTGFYAGLNAGYGFGDERTVFSSAAAGGTFAGGGDYNGFSGGAQSGYNIQFGNVVAGIEADIQYANIGGTFSPIGLSGAKARNTLNSFGTVRGRIGYAFDRFLPYVTGGFAAGQNTNHFGVIGTLSSLADTAVHTGWAAGGGLEYGIRDGWSVKAEYLHIELDGQNYQNGVLLVPATVNTEMKFDIVRGGVNYRF